VAVALLSVLPLLLLPWPIRVILDHVIQEIPIGAQVTAYPFFMQPMMQALRGGSPGAILFWMLGVEAVLLLVVGAFGTNTFERDTSEAYLTAGQDTATKTENEANAGFSLAGGILGYLDFRLTMGLTQSINHHYRSRLFRRIQSLPMRAFQDERIGDAIYRVMYDTPAITNVCYRLLLTPVVAPFSILCVVAIMTSVYGAHPPLLLAAALFAPLTFVATLPFAARVRRSSAQSRGAGATTTATFEEGIANITAVQGLGAEKRERGRFDDDSEASFGAFRGVVRAGIYAYLSGFLVGIALTVWAFVYAGDRVIDGSLDVGDFGVLFPYFVIIARGSIDLGALWIRVQESAAGLERVFRLMDLKGEEDAPDAIDLPRIENEVRFQQVAFEYETGFPVLRDIDFEIRRGQLTALMGPTGAGKTTLAHMIPRFLQPASGRVVVDGADVASVRFSSLRSQVAYVFQETALFDATVEENLRVGRPSASTGEVREAARQAGALDFIEALPQGFDTLLGRDGGKLSGGQKQRLSIARALLSDTPVMIFDEPTASLDPGTEALVVSALLRASRDRLVLLIAHRLSTVRHADRIHYLEGGRIVESGNHRQLMAIPDGRYRRLVELDDESATGLE
jgi:ABC-type multidrug transport system fused ATPase/permease subunit